MTKSTSQYFQGILWVGSGNVLGMVAALVTIAVAVRLTSKEEIGAYFLVMVVAQFGAILGDIGLKNTAIKMLSASLASDAVHTARFLVTVTLISSLAMAFVLTIAVPLVTKLWPYQEFREHAWLGALIAFFVINLQMATSLLVGAGKFKELSGLNAGMEMMKAVISVTALLCGFGASGLLWAVILSRIVGIGLVWRLIPSQFGLCLRHPEGMAMLKFGGWLYGCSVLSLVMVKASDTMLATYMGIGALAIYSAAMQLPSALLRVFESIRPVLLGYASSRENTAPVRLVESVRIGAGLLAVLAAILMGIADPLMTLLFSPEYGVGAKVMQALCAWTAISIVNYYFSITLIGNGSPHKAFILIIPQVIISIVTTWLLVPSFQGLGAAIALTITSLLGNMIGAWVVAGNNRALFLSLNAAHLRAALPLLTLLIAVCVLESSAGQMVGMVSATLGLLVLLGAVTVDDGRQLLAAAVKHRRQKISPPLTSVNT